MNAIKCFSFLLFVALATGNVVLPDRRLMDPWRDAREGCQKHLGLSDADLAEGNDDLNKVKDFLVCINRKLGVIDEDGVINNDAVLKSINSQVPISIARPIANCCINEVNNNIHDGVHNLGRRVVNWVGCWKNKLVPANWRLLGLLGEPVYPLLNSCQKW